MAAEMGLADLKARIGRLDKLARGFSLEVGRWKGDDGLLLFRERKWPSRNGRARLWPSGKQQEKQAW
jgi:hypothetical protein